MSKSAAKKYRDKRIREGKLNPGTGRSPFAAADLRSRMTKTKQEMLQHSSRKHKNQLLEGSREDSFFCRETA
ncbi:hypothetical protein AWM70_02150 [Paenibacillus yonginensis]|uniref:YqkK n=1 Tax=Paenibacillus yonginensis TaxID=1462996 RepID=A0A1B1MWI4_9BACL|nr:hypothetical protein [Paenibacillus yonginensis]ANS73528.1 hypothetical protein AWM70_02150 [Paenibacillus yonginensis]